MANYENPIQAYETPKVQAETEALSEAYQRFVGFIDHQVADKEDRHKEKIAVFTSETPVCTPAPIDRIELFKRVEVPQGEQKYVDSIFYPGKKIPLDMTPRTYYGVYLSHNDNPSFSLELTVRDSGEVSFNFDDAPQKEGDSYTIVYSNDLAEQQRVAIMSGLQESLSAEIVQAQRFKPAN